MECTIRLRERHGDTFQKKEIEEASSQRRAPQCARRAWNYYFSFVWLHYTAYTILVPQPGTEHMSPALEAQWKLLLDHEGSS